MDHEAFEKEMIDTVNRHSGEWDQVTFDCETTDAPKSSKVKSADLKTLWLGLKRTMLALFTALLFGLSVFAFIEVATATGYWAVALFFAGIVMLVWTVILLYAQGIINVGSRGESK